MKNRLNILRTNLSTAAARLYFSAREKLREERGQFVIDHAVVFVLIIVLGGIALTLLSSYLKVDLSNTLKTKIDAFFN